MIRPVSGTPLSYPPDPIEWDTFAGQHARGTLYHQWRWCDFAGAVFGFKVHLLSERGAGGSLIGVFPVVEQRSILFGRRFVSLPFLNYGGPLGTTAEVEASLIDRASRLAKGSGATQLEVRDTVPRQGFATRSDKVTLELALPGSVDALGKALGSKLRSQVRRADRESPEVACGGFELVHEFYPVFAATMRDLGTPVYPRRFFTEMLARLGADCTVVIVRLRGRPAAAALLTHFRDRTEIPWAASLHELRATSVNMRLYWECLVHAIGRGSRVFDFGRSTVDAGTYRFKLQWGSQPRQLYWIYPLAPAGAPAGGHGQWLARAQSAWSRLPLPVANALGPWVSPGLPW
jgi:FemAB-related protein (PEP-CTERM system-associated)